MIAPILRLVLIYFALIAGVLAVFNRETLAGLLSGGGGAPATVAATVPAAPMPIAPTPTPAPVFGSAPAPEAIAPPPAEAPAANLAPAAGANAALAIATAVNTARAVFWSGDIEGARAQVQALVRAHPANADLLGELGNLHFALRDYPAAADAWYRAGLMLLDQGQGPGRRGFLQALSTIDPEKAADLAARAQGR